MKDMSFLTLCFASLRSPVVGLGSFLEVENSTLKMLSIYISSIVLYSGFYLFMTGGSAIDFFSVAARHGMFVFGLTLFPVLWISFSLYFVGAKKGFFIYYSLMLWSLLIFIIYTIAINSVLYFISTIFNISRNIYPSLLISQFSILLILSIFSSVISYKISYFRAVAGHLMGLSVFIIVPMITDIF